MTPLTDPRPYADVLRDWLAQHDLTPYAAASRLGTTQVSIGRWMRGTPCTHERAYRGLMTALDVVNDTAPTTADSAKSR